VHLTGQWIIGNHLEASAEQMQRLQQMLERNKASFAYSMSERLVMQGLLGLFTLSSRILTNACITLLAATLRRNLR
jgi:hypothetical protein